MAERIFIVIGADVVLMAYRGANGPTLAGMHSRCISGTTVIACDLADALPPEILADIQTEWDSDADEDTPVTEVPLRDIDDASTRKG